MKNCIYCRKDKDEKDFSLEHIIPQFLGGAHAPDFLKTRNVCKTCNNNLGLFVDASFEKNWLVTNWLRQSSSAFYSKENPVGVSLVCMGNTNHSPPDLPKDHVCEMWLGPHGEQVFWIRPHDERLTAYVGGNPRTMKDIETRAYFLFAENTSKDVHKTWLSFEQAFHLRKVKKILCGEVEGADPTTIGFTEPDELDKTRRDFFMANAAAGLEHKAEIVIDTKFDQRFLCKLAIGIAFCLFGSKVLDSAYGKELHNGLWYRNGNDQPKIHGTNLFSKNADSNLNETIGFPNAVTFLLFSSEDGISLNLNISSQLNWTILCAPKDILTEHDIAKIGDGQILLLVRAMQVGVYLELPFYLACKCGYDSHPTLNAILKRLTTE